MWPHRSSDTGGGHDFLSAAAAAAIRAWMRQVKAL